MAMDAMVVGPELVEEALMMVRMVHQLLVLSMVEVVSVVELSPGLAVHVGHEDHLHGVGCLHHEGHGLRM